MHRGLFFALALAVPVSAEEILVTDAGAFARAAKRARAGDTLILRDGSWAGVRLRIHANGTADGPVTIRAQTPGKVVFTGDSRLSLAGGHLVVDGLWFQNPRGEESIELRTGSTAVASDCRITNCAVTNDAAAYDPEKTTRFVSVYGARHRIDHCYLGGKTTPGATLVVWLAEGAEAGHRIDHNHFGPREPLGRNGGETIRLGDSATSMLNAACLVEQNLFEKCNGEVECISNKSCGNVYRGNTFKSVAGTLTLRHGNACRVEHNVFLGEGARGTGGVRIIGEDHTVTGNHFQDLTGDAERSAVCLMLGIPDSAPSGYFQVKRASVTGNTFVNCEHNILIGLSGAGTATLPPVGTVIRGNRIQANRGKAFEFFCATGGIVMEDNETGGGRMEFAPRGASERTGPAWR
jgi:poly(beta-D-mannuronate) lyase